MPPCCSGIDRLNLLRNDTYENGSLAQNPLFAQYLELAQKNADNPLNVRTYNALTEWNYDADSPSAADNDSLLVTLARKALTLYAQGKEMAESNHLCNFLTQMQTPRAQLKAMPEELYPGSTCQLSLQVRNLKEVKLRITPLYDSAADYDKAEAQRNQASPNFGKLAQKNRGKRRSKAFAPLQPLPGNGNTATSTLWHPKPPVCIGQNSLSTAKPATLWPSACRHSVRLCFRRPPDRTAW